MQTRHDADRACCTTNTTSAFEVAPACEAKPPGTSTTEETDLASRAVAWLAMSDSMEVHHLQTVTAPCPASPADIEGPNDNSLTVVGWAADEASYTVRRTHEILTRVDPAVVLSQTPADLHRRGMNETLLGSKVNCRVRLVTWLRL